MPSRRTFLTILLAAAARLAYGIPVPPTPRTGFFTDDRMLAYPGLPGHDETPERLKVIQRHLAQTGLADLLAVVSAVEPALPHIRALHSAAHVEAISKLGAAAVAAETAVSGVLTACRMAADGQLRNAFCATRPPGHHALNQEEQYGYCYYNTIAVAARFCQRELGLKRVLIVDWDYHFGDGTFGHFVDDNSVMVCSIHNRRAFPGTAPRRIQTPGGNLSIHLRRAAGDADFLVALDRHILPAAERFSPDIVLVSAGFDGLAADPQGTWKLTPGAYGRATTALADLADRHCRGRLVSMLEGGYHLQSLALAAAAHVRALMGEKVSIDGQSG